MNENSGYKDLDDDIVELLQKFYNMVNSSNYSYVDYDDCIVILDSYIYLGEINKAKIALDYFVSLHPEPHGIIENEIYATENHHCFGCSSCSISAQCAAGLVGRRPGRISGYVQLHFQCGRAQCS